MEGKHPKNMQELLKFAIRNQTQEPDSADSGNVEHMDKDKVAFLENVLNSMTFDVVAELAKAINILQSQPTNEQKIDALEAIRDVIDNMDFANSFVKIGGTTILIKSAEQSEVANVRTNAINIIAEMSQNNPFCQQHFLDCNVIQKLVSFLSENNDGVISSSLYALSSMMNNFEAATTEFIKCNGVLAILPCLGSSCSRVFVKACFLISTISSQFPTIRDEFVAKQTFEKLAESLEPANDFDVKAESLLMSMSTLVDCESCKPAEHLKKNIVNTLKQNLTNCKGLPQCEEMVIYSNKILENIL